ncbi:MULTISPECIES: hypothetical protein [unclassified Streptomyces]|uniref:hypothetical protein n=1 Tax=unclassified Streptomyces TaxID=2593676 RepID=UPI00236648BF|nr:MULTISPECIES: hypothetical protein [unclassified Streptomyces]MDF3140378.1 hypothetical protein [Streptomyces sp. T21Q-yed]WDF39463.1 hypothetical protein PBV52_22990 [Streptomyces sp. T12]
MTDLIHRLAAWVALLLKPRGAHRRPARPPHLALVAPPRPRVMPLPAHRSPYGLDTPLDATATRSVRPYLTAHEQRQRRRELALAALGQDMPGPYWIHGLEVA